MLLNGRGERFLSAIHQSSGARRWVAVAAAYLLVLQAVFAGLASGAQAGGFTLDRSLAMTLCAPGEMPPLSGTDKGTPNHDRMSCCVLGCALSGGALPAPAASFLPVVHRPVDLIAFALRLDKPQGSLAGHSPANPRAPPALV